MIIKISWGSASQVLIFVTDKIANLICETVRIMVFYGRESPAPNYFIFVGEVIYIVLIIPMPVHDISLSILIPSNILDIKNEGFYPTVSTIPRHPR